MSQTQKNNKKAANSKKRTTKTERAMEYADPNGQVYGVIERAMGMCRFSIACVDGVKRTGCIRGSIKKKTKVAAGDVVIVSLREFEDSKCDIIHKYDDKAISQLRREGLIPNDVKVVSSHDDAEDDGGVEFDFNSLEQEAAVLSDVEEDEEDEEVDVDDI